ncbi:DUF6116 family protein, partial [Xanthomonas campestris]
MRNPLTSRALDWASKLRYPTLFKLAAALFLVDMVVPDPEVSPHFLLAN